MPNKKLFELFKGLTRAHGIYSIEGRNATKNKVEGKGVAVQNKLTEIEWHNHLIFGDNLQTEFIDETRYLFDIGIAYYLMGIVSSILLFVMYIFIIEDIEKYSSSFRKRPDVKQDQPK